MTTPAASVDVAAIRAAAVAHCRNCGSVAAGRYCPACGQATALHPPTVREFVHEFLTHHVAVEGALWRTLSALLVHPSRLTAEYFAGRRARYIGPLRLYLTASLLLFALGGTSGSSLEFSRAVKVQKSNEKIDAPIVIGLRRSDDGKGDSGTGIATIDRALARIDAMTPAERSARIDSGLKQLLPYTLILLVPVLALYLQLLYWRRHRYYGEHLVVAFHAQTAVFIVASFVALVPDGPIGDSVALLACIAIVVHGAIALRRVYGGPITATLLREGVLFAAYGLTVSLAVAVATVVTLAR